MSDETRPSEGDTSTDTPGEQDAPQDDVSAGQTDEQDPGEPDTPADALPALDADDDPDSLAGDFTDPDVDLGHLEVEHDEYDDEDEAP